MKVSNRVKTIMGALVLATLFGSDPVSAHEGFGHGGWLMRGRLATELQLSDDQKTQIQSLLTNHRETIRPLYQQLREKRTALQEVTRSETFDEAQVQSLAQELATLEVEIMVNHARITHAALAVLTPEQRMRLDELCKQRRQQIMEWRERHLKKSDPQQGQPFLFSQVMSW